MLERERRQLLQTQGMSPDGARKKLDFLGVTPVDYSHFRNGGFGSHYTRALITIAEGAEVRLLEEVYEQERMKDALPTHPSLRLNYTWENDE